MERSSSQDFPQSTEKLLKDLKAVVQDGEQLLRATAQDLTERGMAARETITNALIAARETRRRLELRARERARATQELIRDHPYELIGVGFVIGVLIGLSLKRF